MATLQRAILNALDAIPTQRVPDGFTILRDGDSHTAYMDSTLVEPTWWTGPLAWPLPPGTAVVHVNPDGTMKVLPTSANGTRP